MILAKSLAIVLLPLEETPSMTIFIFFIFVEFDVDQ